MQIVYADSAFVTYDESVRIISWLKLRFLTLSNKRSNLYSSKNYYT